MKKILFMLSLLFFGNLVIGQDVIQKYDSDGYYNGIIPYEYGPYSYIAYGIKDGDLFLSFLDNTGLELNTLQATVTQGFVPNEVSLRCKFLMVDKYDANILWGLVETVDLFGPKPTAGDDSFFRLNIVDNEVIYRDLNHAGEEMTGTLHQTGVDEIMYVANRSNTNIANKIINRTTNIYPSLGNLNYNEFSYDAGSTGWFYCSKSIFDEANAKLYGIKNSTHETGFFNISYNNNTLNHYINYNNLFQSENSMDFVANNNGFAIIAQNLDESSVEFFLTDFSGTPTMLSQTTNSLVYSIPGVKLFPRKILNYGNQYICIAAAQDDNPQNGVMPDQILVLILDEFGNIQLSKILKNSNNLIFQNAILTDDNNLIIMAHKQAEVWDPKNDLFIKFDVEGLWDLCYIRNQVVNTSVNFITATLVETETESNSNVDSILFNPVLPSLNPSVLECDCDFNVSMNNIKGTSCFETCDGSARIITSGGSAPYIYSITGANSGLITSSPSPTFSTSTLTLSSLCADTYTVEIEDAEGCYNIVTFTITMPAQLSALASLTHESCALNDARINLFPSGGTAPYSFTWTGPNGFSANTEDINGIQGGTYTIVIIDANGCTIEKEYVIGKEQHCCEAGNDPLFVKLEQISGDYVIDGADDSNGDNVIYLSGKIFVSGQFTVDEIVLDITNCDLVFDMCSEIKFVGNSSLRANNSVFRPCADDGFWNGIVFENYKLNLINECIFKKAFVGLKLSTEKGANPQAKIENNLFQNCYKGVQFLGTKSMIGDYTYPIGGNSFILDQDLPILEDFANCMDISQTFPTALGIDISISKHSGEISQNIFVNNRQQNTGGIGMFECYGSKISENAFTDFQFAVGIYDAIDSKSKISIENNEIEISRIFENGGAQIFANSCHGALAISGNEIRSSFFNTEWISGLNGIELQKCSNAEITRNEIVGGFSSGIFLEESSQIQCTSNEISDFRNRGIILSNTSNSKISCNTIEAYDLLTLGIDIQNSTSNSKPINHCNQLEIYSNCILNSYGAIRLYSSHKVSAENIYIRDNFLFNYYSSGINNFNFFKLHIGDVINQIPGQNTFWSNRNSQCKDIFSSSTITTEYANYGVTEFNPYNGSTGVYSFTTTSSIPIDYYSTSACAMQVADLDNQQTNLNLNYACEYSFTDWSDEFDLAKMLLVLEEIPEKLNRFNEARAYYETLAIYEVQKSKDWLEALENGGILEPTALNQLKFIEALASMQWNEAYTILNIIGKDEFSIEPYLPRKLMLMDKLDIQPIINIKEEELIELQEIASQENGLSNLARTILMKNFGQSNTYFNKADFEDHSNENLPSISVTKLPQLTIYPNPGSDLIQIKFQGGSESFLVLDMYDLQGKRIYSENLSFTYGISELDISFLADGMYMFTLSNGKDYHTTSKFVKR